MKWITREKVKVDRVACPWLIKKFIDRNAEFIFLSADTDWSRYDALYAECRRRLATEPPAG